MSKDNQEAVVSKSEFSLVRAIVNLFKLGEEGKVETFFSKIRKTLTREVATLEKALEVINFNYTNDIEDAKEAILDAQAAVNDAYMQVDVKQLATSSDSENFAHTYWRQVELAEANLKTLEEKVESDKEAHEALVKKQKEQIAERKRRLVKISDTSK